MTGKYKSTKCLGNTDWERLNDTENIQKSELALKERVLEFNRMGMEERTCPFQQRLKTRKSITGSKKYTSL